MELFYCSRWWIKKKKAVDILTEEEAKSRHDTGKVYTAVITSDDKIAYVIDILKDYIILRYMDENINPYLIYEFHKVCENDIFLKGITYFGYEGEGEESYIFNFSTDGTVSMERKDNISNTMEERVTTCDVSEQYGTFPEFGQYEDLLKIKPINPIAVIN